MFSFRKPYLGNLEMGVFLENLVQGESEMHYRICFRNPCVSKLEMVYNMFYKSLPRWLRDRMCFGKRCLGD